MQLRVTKCYLCPIIFSPRRRSTEFYSLFFPIVIFYFPHIVTLRYNTYWAAYKTWVDGQYASLSTFLFLKNNCNSIQEVSFLKDSLLFILHVYLQGVCRFKHQNVRILNLFVTNVGLTMCLFYFVFVFSSNTISNASTFCFKTMETFM